MPSAQLDEIFNPLGLDRDAPPRQQDTRQLAMRFGEAHGRAMRAFQNLAREHGGGVFGTLRDLVAAGEPPRPKAIAIVAPRSSGVAALVGLQQSEAGRDLGIVAAFVRRRRRLTAAVRSTS